MYERSKRSKRGSERDEAEKEREREGRISNRRETKAK